MEADCNVITLHCPQPASMPNLIQTKPGVSSRVITSHGRFAIARIVGLPRRVTTRYDKLAVDYLAFVQPASIRLWLRVNESTLRPWIASVAAYARRQGL